MLPAQPSSLVHHDFQQLHLSKRIPFLMLCAVGCADLSAAVHVVVLVSTGSGAPSQMPQPAGGVSFINLIAVHMSSLFSPPTVDEMVTEARIQDEPFSRGGGIAALIFCLHMHAVSFLGLGNPWA